MLEHYKTRKSQQMEAQIKRVSDQSNKLFASSDYATSQCPVECDSALCRQAFGSKVLETIDDETIASEYLGEKVTVGFLQPRDFSVPSHLAHLASFLMVFSDVLIGNITRLTWIS